MLFGVELQKDLFAATFFKSKEKCQQSRAQYQPGRDPGVDGLRTTNDAQYETTRNRHHINDDHLLEVGRIRQIDGRIERGGYQHMQSKRKQATQPTGQQYRRE